VFQPSRDKGVTMAGFVAILGAAIPVMQTLVEQIKKNIDDKTKQASPQAAQAASTQLKDDKKGTQAAAAVTPVVVAAAKDGAQQAGDTLAAQYKQAQLKLGEQLAIVASIRPFFIAQDHIFAMRELLNFKDQELDADDLQILMSWWKAANSSLNAMAPEKDSLLKLEDPERTTILFVLDAQTDGTIDEIDQAIQGMAGQSPRYAVLVARVSDLHDRLNRATFAALSVLQDLSDGLKGAAS
jgi:hypothetical protein